MSRALVGIVFIIAMCSAAWTAESEDVKQIRDLLNLEFSGHAAGDPDQIMSCFAPGFVGYWAGRGDVNNWVVALAGLDSLRSGYADNALQMKEYLESHPGMRHDNEVRHVHVVGEHAVAASYHWSSLPDSTARLNIINEHQSAWMLTKTDNGWRITNFIGAVTSSQKTQRWAPE